MLDGIGDEGVAAADARLRQRCVEDAARRADKGLAGEVLLVARLLAEQDQSGAGAALPRDDLGRKFVERAAPAFCFGGGECPERSNRSDEGVLRQAQRARTPGDPRRPRFYDIKKSLYLYCAAKPALL
jgi:hypothetical protein